MNETSTLYTEGYQLGYCDATRGIYRRFEPLQNGLFFSDFSKGYDQGYTSYALGYPTEHQEALEVFLNKLHYFEDQQEE